MGRARGGERVSAFTPPIKRRNHGRGHSYVDANGLKVPGVTTIINSGVPKQALVGWAGRTVAAHAVDHWDELGELAPSERLKRLEKAPNSDRDTAGMRGTKVHALAVKLAVGEQVRVPDELAGHVESYVRFLDEWVVTPLLSEAVVCSHRHGYAGTLDLIADLADPDEPGRFRRWLLDIKTARSGVFGENALQLAGYRYSDAYLDDDGEEQELPDVELTGVVHVRADGYDLIPVTAERQQHRQFLYAQQVKQFCDDSRDLVGDALMPPTPLEDAS